MQWILLLVIFLSIVPSVGQPVDRQWFQPTIPTKKTITTTTEPIRLNWIHKAYIAAGKKPSIKKNQVGPFYTPEHGVDVIGEPIFDLGKKAAIESRAIFEVCENILKAV